MRDISCNRLSVTYRWAPSVPISSVAWESQSGGWSTCNGPMTLFPTSTLTRSMVGLAAPACLLIAPFPQYAIALPHDSDKKKPLPRGEYTIYNHVSRNRRIMGMWRKDSWFRHSNLGSTCI